MTHPGKIALELLVKLSDIDTDPFLIYREELNSLASYVEQLEGMSKDAQLLETPSETILEGSEDRIRELEEELKRTNRALDEAISGLADMHEDDSKCKFGNPENDECYACWIFEQINKALEGK